MTATISRRTLIRSGAAGLGVSGFGLVFGLGGIGALAAAPADREARRLANRLELWGAFARKSDNLLARYTSTRTSPLLAEDLVGSGALAFVAPGTLVLRDDSATGSTTRIEPREVARVTGQAAGRQIAIVPNDPSLPRRELPPPSRAPALRWLAEHLVACFAPGDGTALIADARVEVPRGSSPRLSLMPPRDSAARALIRSVTLTLDQVGGAVLRVEIAESDGGVFVLKIADHRQNVDTDLLARVLG